MAKEAAKTELVGQATADQIAAWKKEHKEIFSITVENHVGYFKKPNRTIIALASTKVKENPIGYVETILENTFIGGSREIVENDDFFLAAMTTAEKLVEIKTAELVKL
jgi:hypothetical protein